MQYASLAYMGDGRLWVHRYETKHAARRKLIHVFV